MAGLGKRPTGRPPKTLKSPIAHGTRGPGRPKGSRNKLTVSLKAMIEEAVDRKGGTAYFVRLADECPAAFANLLGRVIPVQVQGEMAHSGALTISWQPLLARAADKRRGLPTPADPPRILERAACAAGEAAIDAVCHELEESCHDGAKDDDPGGSNGLP